MSVRCLFMILLTEGKFAGKCIEVKSPTSSGQDRVTCIGAMLVKSCQVKQF